MGTRGVRKNNQGLDTNLKGHDFALFQCWEGHLMLVEPMTDLILMNTLKVACVRLQPFTAAMSNCSTLD
ncbi:unnamed protein product [Camellia sinensis]